MSKWEGPLATLMLPNATGGANWQGGSIDPETNILYIFSNTTSARCRWRRPIRSGRTWRLLGPGTGSGTASGPGAGPAITAGSAAAAVTAAMKPPAQVAPVVVAAAAA